MISITCTQCKTVLTIDEAFAGGVCRCQYCGTIQTVPAQLKANASSSHASSSTTSKALYQKKSSGTRTGGGNVATTGSSPSGLDDLAQAVVSSGLSGSGLRNSRASTALDPTQIPKTPQAQFANSVDHALGQTATKKRSILPIAIGGGVVLLAVVGVALYFMVFRAKTDASGTILGGNPNFCSVALTGNSVIYVLDRGNNIKDDFDTIKAATYASITALGPDRKFAVILWNNGGDDIAFPAEGLRNATSDQIDQLKAQVQDAQGFGVSTLRGALERAIARNPASIVIVTAKPTLGEEDDKALADNTAGGKIKFYTFVVGLGPDNNLLKMTAKGTGGQYRLLSSKELRAAVQ